MFGFRLPMAVYVIFQNRRPTPSAGRSARFSRDEQNLPPERLIDIS